MNKRINNSEKPRRASDGSRLEEYFEQFAREGSMNLTPPEHEHTAAIDETVHWLASLPQYGRPRPLIPALRKRFGLSLEEASEACREAHLIRARAL